MKRKRRETGPLEIPYLMSYLHTQWKDNWIDEFFGDLFALFTIGPAYAWSHLHLTMKKSSSIYKFSTILPQSHPSDDSRMKIMLIALEKLGFGKKANEMNKKWNEMPITLLSQHPVEYLYAYPDKLMELVCAKVFEGIESCGFTKMTSEKLKGLDDNSITKIFNETWNRFWNDPDNFREWEEKKIEELKSNL